MREGKRREREKRREEKREEKRERREKRREEKRREEKRHKNDDNSMFRRSFPPNFTSLESQEAGDEDEMKKR